MKAAHWQMTVKGGGCCACPFFRDGRTRFCELVWTATPREIKACPETRPPDCPLKTRGPLVVLLEEKP